MAWPFLCLVWSTDPKVRARMVWLIRSYAYRTYAAVILGLSAAMIIWCLWHALGLLPSLLLSALRWFVEGRLSLSLVRLDQDGGGWEFVVSFYGRERRWVFGKRR